MAHPVVHFEISGPDTRQLADFYSGLFGWQTRAVGGVDYTLIDTRGPGINGGITSGTRGITFYIETDDMQAALDKINLVGGKTVTPITELPGMATFALFEDLDGLVVGLVLGPGPGDAGAVPEQATDRSGGAPVDWFEILGADATRSQRFYAEIFGWQVSPAGSAYGMVDTGTSRGIRGGIGAGEAGPRVTVYASVTDVAAALARAEEVGGSRVQGPTAADGQRQTGALRDPAGNVVGVYHHARH